MKKVLFLLLFCVFFNANAQEKKVESKLTKNGFYFDLFLGTMKTDYSSTVGFGGGVKLGNVWYFGSNENWKPGFKTTWVREATYFDKGVTTLQLSVANVGFANVFKFNEKMGLELNMNTGYNALINIDNSRYENHNPYNSFSGGGMMFNPEVKFRYKILAIGLDFVFSKVKDFSDDQHYNGFNYVYTKKETGFTSINLSLGAKF